MPEGREQIVRLAYQHLNRGDADALVELCDPDFVMDMSERVFNPEVYRGADGIRRFFADVHESWESYRWDVEDTQASGVTVVAILRCEGRGRGGGPPVDWRVAWLWRFRGETPVALRFYRDRSTALDQLRSAGP